MAIVLIRAVRTKKNANYGVQLFLKRPSRLGCFVLVFFRNSWCFQVQWYSVMFSRENRFCFFINHETASFLIICFCSSVSYFIPFFFFSPFFALLPPLVLFHKLWQTVFLFFSSAFVLVFPCVSNAARRCQQRSSTGRSTPLLLNPSPSPKKCCLTEDDQLGFLGNCLPTPPLSHR